MFTHRLITTLFLFSVVFIKAQQPIDPSNYLESIIDRADVITAKLDKHTGKTLAQLSHQEERIKKKLLRLDPIKAKKLLGDEETLFRDLDVKMRSKIMSEYYIPSLDTLITSLAFFSEHPEIFQATTRNKERLRAATDKIHIVERKFQQAEKIKRFIGERKQLLTERLESTGFARELEKLNKCLYYYTQQVEKYKSLLKDHKKAERKMLELLCKSKLFKDFMQRNSILASLFRQPTVAGDPASQSNLHGLQTRTEINSLIQRHITAGNRSAIWQLRQNIQVAQSRLNKMKHKVNGWSSNGSSDITPDGLKPNTQRTKSFWQRLEVSTNIGTHKATGILPVTSDLGLSLGYKLNDRSTAGIGISYKLGWGKSRDHIRLTSEGGGLRSFIDWKIKKSLWITGGFEMNYRRAFAAINPLKYSSGWQPGSLLGLTKVVNVQGPFFKKTKIQVLWDFCTYNKIPATPRCLVRIGYNLN